MMLAPSAWADDDEFQLDGTARRVQDPENSANDVIRIRTDQAPFFGTVNRSLKVKIDKLDHMLEFKSYFVAPKTCVGGSPRMTLLIDANGDGKLEQAPNGPDFAAHGHVNPPTFAACPQNTWLFHDFTDDEVRWEITPANAVSPPIGPIGGPSDVDWDDLEAFITTTFPQHKVCSAALVDDTFGATGMRGTAYYDLISIGNATFANRDDLDGRGSFKCGDRDDDDDDDD
jgi:hypothetical protein